MPYRPLPSRRSFLQALGAGSIGTATVSRLTRASEESITVEGAGADIWNDYDEFHYYYKEVDGDFDVTVKIDDLEATDEWAKAGLMVRQSLADSEEHAMIRKTPGNETSFQWRSDNGDDAESTTSDSGEELAQVPDGTISADWQRLVREGEAIRAYGSNDGEDWTLIAEISPSAGTIDFADSAYVGLAVTSHDEGTLCSAQFSELSGLSPSENTDIGDVEVAGSVSTDDGGGDTDPIVTTGSASNVTHSSASLVGAVDSLGRADEAAVAFEYRTAGASSWTATEAQRLSSTGTVSYQITDLTPETAYEFRAVLEASDGDTDTGSINSFETATDESDGILVEGAGADIWNSADEGHYYFTDVTGDFDAVVRVDELQNTDEYAKAGLHFRESLDADAKNVMVRRTPGHESSVQWRPETGESTTSLTASDGESQREISGGTMEADYQRLLRTDDTFRAYGSTNGEDWTLMAELTADELDISEDGYLGLAVTSHDEGTLCAAEFSELAGVSPTHNQDIGDVDVPGSVSGDDGGPIDTNPAVATGSASNISSTTATLAGRLDSLGKASSATVMFEYRTVESEDHGSEMWLDDFATTGSLPADLHSGSYERVETDDAAESDDTGSASWTSTSGQELTSPDSFSESIEGLAEDTTYEFRAVVEAADGDTDTGAITTFTTAESDTAPVIVTGEAIDIEATTATATGTLEAFGGQASSADVSVEYRPIGDEDDEEEPEWNRSNAESVEELGEFEVSLFGLSGETEYEYRAVAEAEDGDTATGETRTFTTAEESDGGSGGSHYDYTDGFTTPAPWVETEDVDVYVISDPDYGQVKEAFQASDPRVVVFECSGTIEIEDETLDITEDKCWVAGQTAPSPGITFIKGQFQVDADDCVIQHIRSRHGPGSSPGSIQSNDAVNTDNDATNTVFDHVTASWGTDECMSIGYYGQQNTMTNCLVYEGLWNPYGEGADHNYATLIGNDNKEVFLAGNVWAKTRGRMPRLKGGTETVIVNNIGYFFDESANADSSAVTTFVGNGYLCPDVDDQVLEGTPTAYLEDNFTADPPLEAGTNFAGTESESSPPLWPDGLEVLPSQEVERNNLQNAGARPADRTYHDRRIVEEIRNREGIDYLDDQYEYWVGHQDEVGGFPDLEVNRHDLDVPESDLREWLESWARAVEVEGASPP